MLTFAVGFGETVHFESSGALAPPSPVGVLDDASLGVASVPEVDVLFETQIDCGPHVALGSNRVQSASTAHCAGVSSNVHAADDHVAAAIASKVAPRASRELLVTASFRSR